MEAFLEHFWSMNRMTIKDMERGEILPNLNRWQAGYSFIWINDNKNENLTT